MCVALPSRRPGGLEAPLDDHFGHCELYTLVEVEGDRMTLVGTLPPIPHGQGGCLAAVDHLARHGVQVLIAGGMGQRPLQGFQKAGIAVYRSAGSTLVREALDAFRRGELERFTENHTCRGHHGAHV